MPLVGGDCMHFRDRAEKEAVRLLQKSVHRAKQTSLGYLSGCQGSRKWWDDWPNLDRGRKSVRLL